MSHQLCIDDTESEAQATADSAYAAHMTEHSGSLKYCEQTNAWDIPKERLDGKWSTVVCEHNDYTGKTLVDYDPADYPTDEE